MSYDKVVDSARLDHALTSTAEAIRSKTGRTNQIQWDQDTGFSSVIHDIQVGQSSTPNIPEKDVNFYDYDGTLMHSYSLDEVQTLESLPEGPTHDGLTFQGWNWSLEDLKSLGYPMNVGASFITDDGKTRVYIRLSENRTSPILSVCPNGTVDIDWGDGTPHDTLTGTSTTVMKATPAHIYGQPGDYVITITVVSGTMGFYGRSTTNMYSCLLRYSTSVNDVRNRSYQNSILAVHIGSNVTSIGTYAFAHCYRLTDVTIPEGITTIDTYAFYSCYMLSSVILPSGMTTLGNYSFFSCYEVKGISIPSSVRTIGTNVFANHRLVKSLTLPEGVTTISDSLATNCTNLLSIRIPSTVTSIGSSAFSSNYSFSHVEIPSSVTTIASRAFASCYSIATYVFTDRDTIPTLADIDAFNDAASDCKFIVPAHLYEDWIIASNWSNWASKIQPDGVVPSGD